MLYPILKVISLLEKVPVCKKESAREVNMSLFCLDTFIIFCKFIVCFYFRNAMIEYLKGCCCNTYGGSKSGFQVDIH